MRGRGFSLVEVMVVIVIVAILAGLITPVLLSAKRSGKEANTISNLRQCGLALAIYAPDADIAVEFESAKVALEKAPVMDPDDYSPYRKTKSWPAPFIGSYGYIRGAQPFVDEAKLRDLIANDYSSRAYPVMASVWHGKPKVSVFEPPLWEPWNGTPPNPVTATCIPNGTCLLPDRITYLMSDGSSKVHRFRVYGSTKVNPMFLWWYVFLPPDPFPKP